MTKPRRRERCIGDGLLDREECLRAFGEDVRKRGSTLRRHLAWALDTAAFFERRQLGEVKHRWAVPAGQSRLVPHGGARWLTRMPAWLLSMEREQASGCLGAYLPVYPQAPTPNAVQHVPVCRERALC